MHPIHLLAGFYFNFLIRYFFQLNSLSFLPRLDPLSRSSRLSHDSSYFLCVSFYRIYTVTYALQQSKEDPRTEDEEFGLKVVPCLFREFVLYLLLGFCASAAKTVADQAITVLPG